MKVLIVDDQAPARRMIADCLAPLADVEILEAATLEEARQKLTQHLVDVALIDLRLDAKDPNNRDGMTLVSELRERGTAIPIIVTVARAMAEIRAAMRAGAYAYILKDELSEELVLPVLRELQSHRALARKVLHLHGLVGTSPAIERLRRQIKKVAAFDAPVLILGPTGSGKELVARALHTLSARHDQPLVAVNCGAFTETLVESQLFGHEKGYFTGADKARDGYLAEAQRGTLFLDEIAELPMALQTKLLRVLENRTYRVLGGSADSRFEGRLIAATHVDLATRAAEGRFRADLFYRLEVLTVRVPSLDERKQDIPALVEHLAKEIPRRTRFTEEAMAALSRIDWIGNVRQLRNLVHRLAVFSEREQVDAADVEVNLTAGAQAESTATATDGKDSFTGELFRGLSYLSTRKQNVLRLSQNQVRLLEAAGHDMDGICQVMDIGRSTLFRIKSGTE